jgi:hypothetical protein
MSEKEDMPQKFTNLSKLISYLENEKPNVRIHNTSKLAPFKLDWKQVSIETSWRGKKPFGFWYAFGAEWLKWCMSENPHWIGRYVYEVEVEVSNYPTIDKVLSTNPEWLQQKFGYVRDNDTKHLYDAELDDFYAMIAWDELAKQVAGIEFSRYDWDARERFMWYYSWDVASGCVWSSSAVKKITLLADLDTEETRKSGRKPNTQL